MEDRVSHLPMRRAQFTGEMMDIMYRRHGVERLEDLQLLTNDILGDVDATVFHRRRLYAALHTEVQRADAHRRYSQLPPRCKDPVRDAFRFARLERFARVVRTRLGATLAKHLAELRRVYDSAKQNAPPPGHVLVRSREGSLCAGTSHY